MNKIFFKDFKFRKIQKKDLKKILKLRNKKKIRAFMINKKLITYKEHYQWYRNSIKSNFFHIYVLIYKTKIIGSGYASNFNPKDKYCYWGVYRDPDIKNEKKYGSIILYLLFEKLFRLRNINHLRCKVIKKNIWVKNWYKSWGNEYLYYEKKNKCHVLKLTKQKWKSKKKNILYNIFK